MKYYIYMNWLKFFCGALMIGAPLPIFATVVYYSIKQQPQGCVHMTGPAGAAFFAVKQIM